ncbi:hypothetical protein AB6C94_19495 [Vibrio splendidus]
MNEQKDISLLPTLRFPEFKDDIGWSPLKLSEVSSRIVKKVGEKQLTTVSISAGKGFVSQAEKFSRDISGKQYKNYIHLKKGDFSYNKGNSKKFAQGCVYRLHEFDEAAAPSAFISFKIDAAYVADFYKGYFDDNAHGRQLLRYITSGARSDGLLNIKAEDFFSIVLPTPIAVNEQQKISECLSSIDEVITAQRKKIESLIVYKKGLMKQLFPDDGEAIPKFRFPEFRKEPEWKLKPFNKVFSRVMTKNKENNKNVLTISAQKGLISQLDYFNKSVSARNVSGYYLLHKGDFAYNKSYSNGYPMGAIKPLKLYEKGVVSTLYICFRANDDDFIDFLGYYFDAGMHNSEIEQYAQEGARNHGLLNIGVHDFFDGTQVLLPQLDEQKKIAKCLSSIDETITAQSKKIEALIAHKKGLMQQLYPVMDEVKM